MTRHLDPIRSRQPTYALGDPLLQFHFAILDRYGPVLRRSVDLRTPWSSTLEPVFRSRVLDAVVEQTARTWAGRFADPAPAGGAVKVLGPSSVSIDGVEHHLDVVIGGPADAEPAERVVAAIGEVKAGEVQGPARLRGLEDRRAALGTRAASAKLLLVGPF